MRRLYASHHKSPLWNISFIITHAWIIKINLFRWWQMVDKNNQGIPSMKKSSYKPCMYYRNTGSQFISCIILVTWRFNTQSSVLEENKGLFRATYYLTSPIWALCTCISAFHRILETSKMILHPKPHQMSGNPLIPFCVIWVLHRRNFLTSPVK